MTFVMIVAEGIAMTIESQNQRIMNMAPSRVKYFKPKMKDCISLADQF